MAKSRFTPADVAALYEKRSSIKTGVTSAEPDMDPGEYGTTPAGRQRIYNHHDVQDVNISPNYAANYSNDTPNDWRRGAASGEGISDGRKPTFDYGNSYKRADGGNDWRSGSDYRPKKTDTEGQ